MKQLLLCLSIAIAFLAFKTPTDYLKAKNVQKNLAKVNDNLYIGKYEVSNREYVAFLESMRRAQSPQYQAYRQDTALWNNVSWSSPYAHYYHGHPSYQNYPVVTISYDAAVAYCNWLSEMYNGDPSRSFKKVNFRLPTIEEWKHAASNGDSTKEYSWGSPYLTDKKGQRLANCLRINEAEMYYDSSCNKYVARIDNIMRRGILAEVSAFYPNTLGIYNVNGNVAEMVAEKGIAIGGSHTDAGYDIRIQSQKLYSAASTEIGFRVAMDVIEK